MMGISEFRTFPPRRRYHLLLFRFWPKPKRRVAIVELDWGHDFNMLPRFLRKISNSSSVYVIVVRFYFLKGVSLADMNLVFSSQNIVAFVAHPPKATVC